jgi:SOS response regulatory protein OraA/RecX
VTPFDLACRWLMRAARSEAEIRLRLTRVGYSARAVDETLRRLCDQRFIDDRQLARNRAQTLEDRGYGNAWIENDLLQRGLAEALVQQALERLTPESERAVAWLTRGSGQRDPAAAWRALLQRGFSADTAESAVGAPDDAE